MPKYNPNQMANTIADEIALAIKTQGIDATEIIETGITIATQLANLTTEEANQHFNALAERMKALTR